jgi:hypothetical protein
MGEKTSLGGFCSRSCDQLCCVSVNKIFDSAKDKDCLEDVKVYVPDCFQEFIDRATAIRSKSIKVAGTNINVEPVPFNKGYFQVCIRYYFCITFEVCICGGKSQEFCGLAVFDKKIILFGSEKNVNIFKSNPDCNSFCPDSSDIRCDLQPTLPTVVLEVADPICLDVKIVEKCKRFGNCRTHLDTIPDCIRESFDGNIVDGYGVNELFVSIGVFSIVRMERPVQIVIPSSTFCLPEKDSTPCDGNSNPCSIFSKMNFPIQEFFPYADDGCIKMPNDKGKCGC